MKLHHGLLRAPEEVFYDLHVLPCWDANFLPLPLGDTNVLPFGWIVRTTGEHQHLIALVSKQESTAVFVFICGSVGAFDDSDSIQEI